MCLRSVSPSLVTNEYVKNASVAQLDRAWAFVVPKHECAYARCRRAWLQIEYVKNASVAQLDRAWAFVVPKHECAYARCRRAWLQIEYVKNASVAQLDRARASDARCRWFESIRAHQTARRKFAVCRFL